MQFSILNRQSSPDLDKSAYVRLPRQKTSEGSEFAMGPHACKHSEEIAFCYRSIRQIGQAGKVKRNDHTYQAAAQYHQ